MADLIDLAPKAETATPPVTETLPPGDVPAGDAAPKTPPDLDAVLEKALAADRAGKEAEKAAATKLKQAQELEARLGKYVGLDEHLTKGQRAAAVEALLGDIDEDLLFDLAELRAKKAGATEANEPTVEEQIEAVLTKKSAEATKANEDAQKAKEEADRQQANREADGFMTKAAEALLTNLDSYPFIKAWGCDAERFKALSVEHMKATKQVPDPAVILQKIEDDHKAKWKKSPFAPKEEEPLTLERHVEEAYLKNRPPEGPTPENTRKLTPAQQAREELAAHDRQVRERIRFTPRA